MRSQKITKDRYRLLFIPLIFTCSFGSYDLFRVIMKDKMIEDNFKVVCYYITIIPISKLWESPPRSIYIADRPKAAILFWFSGDFLCGALLLIVLLVIYPAAKNAKLLN